VEPAARWELIAGQLTMSTLRTLIGVGAACAFAWLLFHYSIFSLGFPLLAFFANLIVCGWAIGLAVSGLVLRMGLGAEELAWAAVFLLAPVSGVYYPIGVLPGWLQAFAHAVPTSYVFEGMRGVLLDKVFRTDLLCRRSPSTPSTWWPASRCICSRSAMPANTAGCCRWGNSAR
jgi:ABC-2 type transport system permease protein